MIWQILWWLSWLLFHCLPSSHSLVQCSTTVHLGTERNFLWSLISNWSWGGFFARILLAKCHFQTLEKCATSCIHSSSMISILQSISLLLPAGWWTATQVDPAISIDWMLVCSVLFDTQYKLICYIKQRKSHLVKEGFEKCSSTKTQVTQKVAIDPRVILVYDMSM